MFAMRVMGVVFQRHVFMSLLLTSAAALVISPAVLNLPLLQQERDRLDQNSATEQEHAQKISDFESTIITLKIHVDELNSKLKKALIGEETAAAVLAGLDQTIAKLSMELEKEKQDFLALNAQQQLSNAKLAAILNEKSTAPTPRDTPVVQLSDSGAGDKDLSFGLVLPVTAWVSPDTLHISEVDPLPQSQPEAAEQTLEVVQATIPAVPEPVSPADLVPEKLRRAMEEEWAPRITTSDLFAPQTSSFALGLMGGGPEPVVLTSQASLPYGATVGQGSKVAILNGQGGGGQSEQLLSNGVLTQAPLDLVAEFTAPKRSQTRAVKQVGQSSSLPLEANEDTQKKRGFFARLFGIKP